MILVWLISPNIFFASEKVEEAIVVLLAPIFVLDLISLAASNTV